MTGFLRGKALWARQAGFAAGFAAALERCQPAKAANKPKQRGVAEKWTRFQEYSAVGSSGRIPYSVR
ncbi:hypothetical protein [Bosea sp. Root670]|uniref:hypothetical protein n=1 Tax=Bosea sp. Root670 TaxID=1736583 RepID=UPI0012E33707|nr:hypothetical protein [Bosea sp. Root670]